MALQKTNKYTILTENGCTDEYTKVRHALLHLPYGKHRRDLIMEYLLLGGEFPINRKCQAQLKNDTDLKRLLKQDKIELFNVREGLKFKTTYVKIKEIK